MKQYQITRCANFANFPAENFTLFYHSLYPLVGESNSITRKALRQFIECALEKTDQELNDSFAHVNVSNCILALAFMKALHIQQICVVDTTTTKGILSYEPFWS